MTAGVRKLQGGGHGGSQLRTKRGQTRRKGVQAGNVQKNDARATTKR